MASATCAEAGPPGALPIDGQLESIRTALSPGSTVLLQAPPGAGKTTRVPLSLLECLPPSGKILLVEPRRLAARAAAERLAAGLGESVGQRVGYQVRLERRCSAVTRIEVVTDGILLRRLQDDPALEGVAAVLFDEFHERRASADLALALVRQSRSLLSPALRLLLMSATLELEPLAAQLDDAVVITSAGRSHPVEVLHQPPRPEERLSRQVLRALEQHWLEQRGPGETVLVFLPGLAEIQAVQAGLQEAGWSDAPELVPLHGNLSLAAQQRAIEPSAGPAGKVVLATSIAESSLTIAGVRLVIDSGLSRRNRFDPRSGMEGLVTGAASQASAEQRSGRAGRLAPGRCIRLWSPAERLGRLPFDPPELLSCDPLPVALQLAEWGDGLGQQLAWLDPPPSAGLAEARQLLAQLGALDAEGRINAHGRAMARLGLHPRLAHMLLRARSCGQLELAAALAVLISERDPLSRAQAGGEVGCDLMARLDWLHQGRAEGPQRQFRQLQQQWLRQLKPTEVDQATAETASGGALGGHGDTEQAALLLSWAYPDRLALARSGGGGRFQLRNGRGAWLPASDPLAACEALVVAAADGAGSDARIQLALPLARNRLEELAEAEGERRQSVWWDSDAGRVRAEQQLCLGPLVLQRQPLQDPAHEALAEALLEALAGLGLTALPWDGAALQLRHRLQLAHRLLGAPWPERSERWLLEQRRQWLGPMLLGRRSLSDLSPGDLQEALWGDLAWEQRQQLELLLPTRVPIPSGREATLDYSSGEPVLAVKLQEMFGCRQGPQLLDGRLAITLQLLSPAGRPLQVTQDLAGFWAGSYRDVRREMRGRYPKHPWPEDPLSAAASTHSQRRLRGEVPPKGARER